MRPILRALALLAPLLLGPTSGCKRPLETLPVDSLAVLTFRSAGADHTSSYLASGLAHWTSLQLNEISVLHVAPRSAVLILERQDLSTRQMGSRLGTAALLLGSVRMDGTQIVATLEIVDSTRGEQIWQRDFSSPTVGILDLQQELLQAVTEALSLDLTARDKARLDVLPTRSLKAWDYFLQAESYLAQTDQPKAIGFAVDLFRRANQLDPGLAIARAELSRALWQVTIREQDPALLPDARRQAMAAIELEPALAAGRLALARIKTCDESQKEVDNLAKPEDALRELALDFRAAGELELAEDCLQLALRRDQDGWRNWHALGQFLLLSGRLGEAAEAFARAADLAQPGADWPLEGLTTTRLRQGDFALAAAAFERMGSRTSEPATASSIASAYALLGRLDDAEQTARLAVRLDPTNPRAHQSLGDLLSARDRPEEARQEYETGLELLAYLQQSGESETLQILEAVLRAKASQCDRALPLAATLRRHLPESARTSHDLALVFAHCGERELSLESLSAAVRSGYSPELIQNEIAFAWLANDAAFREVLDTEVASSPRP